MIGTIRKHSKLLWGIVITAVIISFVWWGANPGGGSGNAGMTGNVGIIYGRPVPQKEYGSAYREMEIRYFFTNFEWPGNDATRRGFDPTRETFYRILLLRKADALEIHAGLDATAKSANEHLRRMNGGNPFALSEFLTRVLTPRGLTGADFERTIRNDLRIQQVLSMAGSSGTLVTPQDARALYEREHQEYVTQAVFFHPSNYVSGVTPTPEALGQFFTNQMAQYRIPERVRVSYVKFLATNFLAEAVAEINQVTNLAERLEGMYQQRGGTNFYTDKTADAAKEEILKEQQHNLALFKARTKANPIATVLLEANPIRAESLAPVAQTNGLTVEITAPFAFNEPPTGLDVGEEFMRGAFGLTESEPIAGPLMGRDAVYVIAAHSRLPSEAPPYEQVRDRVAADYAFYESQMALRAAGFALASSVSNALATGRTFLQGCLDAKAQPVSVPPFSLNSTNLPEVERHVNLTQYKQTMFMTPVGRASGFVPSNDGGGYLMFVEKKLPVDEARLAAALPNYIQTVRQSRQTDALNLWVMAEGQRDPGFRDIMATIMKQNQPSQPGAAPQPN